MQWLLSQCVEDRPHA